MPPPRAAQFLSPVASALDAVHRARLVHRDVKPGNILVDAGPGRPEHVYLSDFGISKGASTAGLTGAGQYLGTPEYTSPEQARGQAVDGQSDQYALACVAWHLLAGSVPFRRDQGHAVLFAHLYEPPPLDALRPGLPAAAGQVLARALAKEPRERYPSCGDFTDALRQALALPRYRPAAAAPALAAPAAAGHPGTRASAAPARPAAAGTADARADRAGAPAAGQGSPRADGRPGGPAATADEPDGPAPAPVTPPAEDGPTQDLTAPGQRLRAGPGPERGQARAARRRRRYLMITVAGTLLAAAAAAIPLLRTPPAAPQLSARPHVGATATPAATRASRKKTVPVAPSGTRTATAAATEKRAKPVPLPGPLTGTLTATLTATLTDPEGQAAAAVAFSPDGATMAAGDQNGRAYLWNTGTGRLTATLFNRGGPGVHAVAFVPDGTTLAAGIWNGSAYLWDTATGELTATLTNLTVWAVAFSPDGTTLATGNYNGRICLWHISKRSA